MKLPIQHNIDAVRIETEEGDLVPVLDYAGDELRKVICAVVANGKAGQIVIKLDVEPSTAGALAVKATVSAKVPKGLPPESLLFPTPEGNLQSEDPRQHKLPLIEVPNEEKPLRVVSQN